MSIWCAVILVVGFILAAAVCGVVSVATTYAMFDSLWAKVKTDAPEIIGDATKVSMRIVNESFENK